MKGTNLNPTVVARLKENTIAPGGLHFFDISNSNVGPRELSLISDCIKANYNANEGMGPLISADFSGNIICGVDLLLNGTPDSEGLNDFVNMLIFMGQMSRLRKISLAMNYLDVKSFSILSKLLTKGPNSIVELNLRDCGATSESIEKLVEGLKVTKSLTSLDLRQNSIGPEGCKHLAEVFLVSHRLKLLNLNECDIGEEGAFLIAKSIQNNFGLEILSLNDNEIGDKGAEAIGTMLKINSKLMHLDLQENCIGFEGIKSISKGLFTNRTLIYLGLQWNDMTDKGAEILGESLKVNNILKSVHVVGNPVTKNGCKVLIQSDMTNDDKPMDLDLGFAISKESLKG